MLRRAELSGCFPRRSKLRQRSAPAGVGLSFDDPLKGERSAEALYEVSHRIGKGSYGTVVAGRNRSTGEKVAIKHIDRVFADKADTVRIIRGLRLRHVDRKRRALPRRRPRVREDVVHAMRQVPDAPADVHRRGGRGLRNYQIEVTRNV